MIGFLDVIAWPMYLFGGAVLFLVVGAILAVGSTVALLIVMWKRRQSESSEKEEM